MSKKSKYEPTYKIDVQAGYAIPRPSPWVHLNLQLSPETRLKYAGWERHWSIRHFGKARYKHPDIEGWFEEADALKMQKALDALNAGSENEAGMPMGTYGMGGY